MVYDQIIPDLKKVFSTNSFTETLRNDELLFVFEMTEKNDSGKILRKFTEMSNIQPANRHFKIKNTDNNSKTAHICIDGDFISYGQEKYNDKSENYSEGRPDCLVFNNQIFLFLELRVEQEDESVSKEDPKWRMFFKGANQILDFVTFLRDYNFEIKSYYNKVIGVVCFRFEPDFSVLKNLNAQRKNQIQKISQKLGFVLVPHNHMVIFEI